VFYGIRVSLLKNEPNGIFLKDQGVGIRQWRLGRPGAGAILTAGARAANKWMIFVTFRLCKRCQPKAIVRRSAL
jgi:hypothetical protein